MMAEWVDWQPLGEVKAGSVLINMCHDLLIQFN
jgi:hypothetical protein